MLITCKGKSRERFSGPKPHKKYQSPTKSYVTYTADAVADPLQRLLVPVYFLCWWAMPKATCEVALVENEAQGYVRGGSQLDTAFPREPESPGQNAMKRPMMLAAPAIS